MPNLNDQVRVRLTVAGWDRLKATPRHFRTVDSVIQALEQYKPDAEGWSTFQLWHLMEFFGPGLYLGMPEPFFVDNEFRFVRAIEQQQQPGHDLGSVAGSERGVISDAEYSAVRQVLDADTPRSSAPQGDCASAAGHVAGRSIAGGGAAERPLLRLSGRMVAIGDVPGDALPRFVDRAPHVQIELSDGRCVVVSGLTFEECRACVPAFMDPAAVTVAAA
jgi:hypothetical protein